MVDNLSLDQGSIKADIKSVVPDSARDSFLLPRCGATGMSPISLSDSWEKLVQSMMSSFQYGSPVLLVVTFSLLPRRMLDNLPSPFSPRIGRLPLAVACGLKSLLQPSTGTNRQVHVLKVVEGHSFPRVLDHDVVCFL